MDIIKILSDGEVRHFGQNSYLVINENDAILIDGSASVSEVIKNLNIFSKVPKIKAIFLTHAHFDHMYNLSKLVERFDCFVYTNKNGEKILKDKNKNLSTMLKNPIKFNEKRFLKYFEDGDEINVGSISIKCYLSPGHTSDGAVFVIGDNMFTGDTVFKTSIGRVDLGDGDLNKLKISLQRIKDDLGLNINTFYPGHGDNFDKNTLDTVVDYYTK